MAQPPRKWDESAEVCRVIRAAFAEGGYNSEGKRWKHGALAAGIEKVNPDIDPAVMARKVNHWLAWLKEQDIADPLEYGLGWHGTAAPGGTGGITDNPGGITVLTPIIRAIARCWATRIGG